MKDIFLKTGLEVTKENRKEIDRIIHSIVGVEYKNCSSTWMEVKKHLNEDEDAFIQKLKDAF
jgi:ATP-dependent Zn protease